MISSAIGISPSFSTGRCISARIVFTASPSCHFAVPNRLCTTSLPPYLRCNALPSREASPSTTTSKSRLGLSSNKSRTNPPTTYTGRCNSCACEASSLRKAVRAGGNACSRRSFKLIRPGMACCCLPMTFNKSVRVTIPITEPSSGDTTGI